MEDRPNRELSTFEQPPLTEKTVNLRALLAIQYVEVRKAPRSLVTVLLVVFSGLFAGIHIAAWNYGFPSAVEAWIWRGSALAITVFGISLSVSIVQMRDGDFDSELAWDWVFLLSVVLYPLIRTTMLVIALMSFRKAPARLYETPSWTQYWPHI